jgi:hypothetical protein
MTIKMIPLERLVWFGMAFCSKAFVGARHGKLLILYLAVWYILNGFTRKFRVGLRWIAFWG